MAPRHSIVPEAEHHPPIPAEGVATKGEAPMVRPATQAVLIKELEERQTVLEAKLAKVRSRKHHQLAKLISGMLADIKALQTKIGEGGTISPVLIGQVESLSESSVKLIHRVDEAEKRIAVLEAGQVELSKLATTTARTVEEHGNVLDTHSGRLNALEAGAGTISVAVARVQAQIDAIRAGRAFNWLAAIITAAVGLAVYLFWFISHDFGGAVLNAQHQATGMTVRSLLNTGWGDAIALTVVLLFSAGIGYLLASETEPNYGAVASASAEATVITAPAVRSTLIGSSRPSGTAPTSVR